MKLLAALLPLLCAACVAPGPTYTEFICGHDVAMHPDDLKPCAREARGCTTPDGLHIYYSTLDPGVLPDERLHACAMRHSATWVAVGQRTCAVIEQGGCTMLRKGDAYCRVDAGTPIKIADERIAAIVRGSFKEQK